MQEMLRSIAALTLALGVAAGASAQDIDPESGGVWVPPPDDTQPQPPPPA